jgi:EEF1A lysine methyltransferase 4
MPDYGNPSYWDERYAARGPTEQFDWYQNFGRLKNQLLQHVDQNAKEFEILVPGCGNSPLPGHLFDHGAKNLTCIDVSTVVVQQQTDRYKNFDTIEFLVGDCLNLDFIPDGCFDLIIEKALGDAVLCGDNSFSNIARLNDEMYRVLKPGGVYISISHGVPQTRLTHLQSGNRQWSINHAAISKPRIVGFDEGNDASDSHFMYVCKKR